jgi:hypothetical protein
MDEQGAGYWNSGKVSRCETAIEFLSRGYRPEPANCNSSEQRTLIQSEIPKAGVRPTLKPQQLET